MPDDPRDATAAPPPQPDPACPRCGGEGVVPGAEGEHARLELCGCIPPCPRCGGTGRVFVQREDGTTVAGRCACQRLPDRVAIFNRAGIPARFNRATLVSFARGAGMIGDGDKIAAFQAAAAWLKSFDPARENRGLVLHGLVGRGKTHLLVAVARSLILDRGVRVRFIEFTRLLGLLREGYGAGRSDAVLLNELAAVPVLAIDELGKGRMTDWELSVIDDIVSRRYNSFGCLLGTSNFRPAPPSGAPVPELASAAIQRQTLGDRLGERTWSRLGEMCDFVEVGGVDYRVVGRSR